MRFPGVMVWSQLSRMRKVAALVQLHGVSESPSSATVCTSSSHAHGKVTGQASAGSCRSP